MGAARRRSSANSKRPVLTLNELIGDWGPYQWNIFMFDVTVQLVTMANVLSLAFTAPKIDFTCDDYMHNVIGHRVNGSSSPVPDPIVSPPQYRKPGFLKCQFESLSAESRPCSSFTYDSQIFGRTLTAEYQLICDNSYLPSLSQSLYVMGYFIASLAAGYCSDRFGRKPVLWLSVSGQLVCGLTCAFPLSMWFFMVSRFLLGIAVYATFMTAYAMVMEVAGTNERTVYGPLTRAGRSVGIIVITIIAYYIRDFRYIQLAVTLPSVLWLYWLTRIPESPRWLLIKGRIDDCVAVVEDAVLTNGIDLSDAGITDVRHELDRMYSSIQGSRPVTESEQKNRTIIDLFRTPVMRRNSLIMCFNWFITVFIYYALSLNVQDLGGNFFVNFFISGLVEIPSIILCIYALKKSGRRVILSSSMVALFFASAVSIPFFFFDIAGSVATRVSLAMIGKFAATIAFSLNYLYSTEIYPTEIRQVGLGMNSAASRLGSMLSPFIKELNESTHVSVSMGLFGLTSLLNAVLVMFLPETKNRNIPDTIEQVETLARMEKDELTGRLNDAQLKRAKIEMKNAIAIISDVNTASSQINGGTAKHNNNVEN